MHWMMGTILLRQRVLSLGQQKQQAGGPEINLKLLTGQMSDRETAGIKNCLQLSAIPLSHWPKLRTTGKPN